MKNIGIGLKNFKVFSKNFTSNRLFSGIAASSTNFQQESDNKEVEHHAKLASQWWDKNGPMKGLHALNELRVPFIRDGLIANNLNFTEIDKSKILQGFEILDVGCGGGILTESLANLNANVTGIDLGKELISVAQDHLTVLNKNVQDRLQYKVESIEVHAKDNNLKYDAIVLSEVIEHIDNKIEFLTNCVQALKIGGSIFITTPNKTFLSWLCVIGIAENIMNIIPKGTHTYDKFINPLDMQRILDSLNCNTIVCNGMFYDVFNNNWIWTSSRELCYALQAIKAE